MLSLKGSFNKKFLSGTKEDLLKTCLELVDSLEFKTTVTIFENNICHKNEAVSTHSLRVFKQFQNLLTLKFLKSETLRQAAINYFGQKIGRFTRAELFLVSSLLHDLGKVNTLIVDEKGITSAPNYEYESIKIAKRILKKLGYRELEIIYILTIIRMHSGYILSFLDYLNDLSSNQLKKALCSVKFLPEIFLYMVADYESAETFRVYKEIITYKFLQESSIYKTSKPLKGTKEIGALIEKILIQLKTISKPWSVETRLFHLSEEVGELHDIYLSYIGAKDTTKSSKDLQNALNDITLETLALYDILGIDIKNSLKNIIKENEK